MESIPQTHLTLILFFTLEGPSKAKLWSDADGNGNYYYSKLVLFFLSFTTSVISASLGMSRLLLNGPSKFIRKTGRLGGYCQWGFVFLILSMITGIVSKAAWLPFVMDRPTRMGYLGAVLWIGVSLIPQLLLVRVKRFMDQVISKLKLFLF